MYGWLIVWVLWHINFCTLSNAKPFLYKKNHLYFKQLSLSWVHSLIIRTFFQAIHFSQTVFVQRIQFSLSIVFIHTQLNAKQLNFE